MNTSQITSITLFRTREIIVAIKGSPWMTNNIKSRLRKICKMTKKYYKYSEMKSYLDELQE